MSDSPRLAPSFSPADPKSTGQNPVCFEAPLCRRRFRQEKRLHNFGTAALRGSCDEVKAIAVCRSGRGGDVFPPCPRILQPHGGLRSSREWDPVGRIGPGPTNGRSPVRTATSPARASRALGGWSKALPPAMQSTDLSREVQVRHENRPEDGGRGDHVPLVPRGARLFPVFSGDRAVR